jgi:predicted oxidoreductase
MNAGRLADCVKAAEITLTKEEWYEILLASGTTLP